MKYSWIHIVDFEVLASKKSLIKIDEKGGCTKVMLLAEDIRNAITIAETKVLSDNYIINYVESAERFDPEHYDKEIHENVFNTMEELMGNEEGIFYVSTIVYD